MTTRILQRRPTFGTSNQAGVDSSLSRKLPLVKSKPPLSVAFIGLGIMGSAMARHILDAGHPLYIWNRTKSKADSLVRNGAKLCASPAAAAKHAQIVCVCVTDTPDVEAVLLKEGGVIESAKAGMVVIDHSTISPKVTREFSKALHKEGVAMLDAPVSGGDAGARAGTLSVMVGGADKALHSAMPILELYSKIITHVGPSGSGQLTKLVNQILVGVNLLAVSEALTFAIKNGLDPQKTLAAVGGGAGGSWQLENLAPKMLAADFRPGFMIDLMQKDLHLLHESADQSRTSLPAASLVHQLFNAAQASGHGRDGTQALFKVIEKLSSVH